MGKKEVEARAASLKLGAKISSLKDSRRRCIGEICFEEDGSITVKVPSDADEVCARMTADAILEGKPFRIEIEPRGPKEPEEPKEAKK